MLINKIISWLLVFLLIFPIVVVFNIEAVSAFTGNDLVSGFWKLIKDLLDLLFLGLSNKEEDSNSEQTTVSSNDSEEAVKWEDQEITELTSEERQMLKLVNQARLNEGLQPLEVDYRLVKVARAKSKDMIRENYFDHFSPNYGSPFDMMEKINIHYSLAGENIAGAPNVKLAYQQLMKSKSHRENILDSNFDSIGIGAAEGGSYGKVYTQEFAKLLN